MTREHTPENGPTLWIAISAAVESAAMRDACCTFPDRRGARDRSEIAPLRRRETGTLHGRARAPCFAREPYWHRDPSPTRRPAADNPGTTRVAPVAIRQMLAPLHPRNP